MSESLGTLTLSGTDENLTKLFRVFRDDREVTVYETDQGTIVVETISWLRKNERKEVRTVNAYTLVTFTMMLEAMHLGADYFGIDVKKGLELLHASEGERINYEYAGAGIPKFAEAAAQDMGLYEDGKFVSIPTDRLTTRTRKAADEEAETK